MDYIQWMPWDSGSQSVVSRTETSALFGKLLEMQFWGPIPDLLNQQWWGVDGVQQSVLYQAL